MASELIISSEVAAGDGFPASSSPLLSTSGFVQPAFIPVPEIAAIFRLGRGIVGRNWALDAQLFITCAAAKGKSTEPLGVCALIAVIAMTNVRPHATDWLRSR